MVDAWEAERVPIEPDDNRVTRPTCGPAEWFAPVVNTVGYCHLVTKPDTTGSWAEAFASEPQKAFVAAARAQRRGAEKPEKDAAPTELRPPPEHADKPLHWVQKAGQRPEVWEWRSTFWRYLSLQNGCASAALPNIHCVGYRYLGPAEWRGSHEPSNAAGAAELLAPLKIDIVTIERERIAALEAENAKLRSDLRTLIASAARPLNDVALTQQHQRAMNRALHRSVSFLDAPPLPTTHAACRHCGAPFLAEVVAAHEASCELRPAAEMVVF